jgi:ribonuclease HI
LPHTRAVGVLIAYYDAAVEPFNPGGHAVGAHVILAHPASGLTDDLEGTSYYGCGREWTANRAEYCAALDALVAIYRLGYRGAVELRGDSLLVANHYSRTWTCSAPPLVPLLERLRHAATVFAGLTITWIPKADNARADALTRQAYRQALQCHGLPRRPAVR